MSVRGKIEIVCCSHDKCFHPWRLLLWRRDFGALKREKRGSIKENHYAELSYRSLKIATKWKWTQMQYSHCKSHIWMNYTGISHWQSETWLILQMLVFPIGYMGVIAHRFLSKLVLLNGVLSHVSFRYQLCRRCLLKFLKERNEMNDCFLHHISAVAYCSPAVKYSMPRQKKLFLNELIWIWVGLLCWLWSIKKDHVALNKMSLIHKNQVIRIFYLWIRAECFWFI